MTAARRLVPLAAACLALVLAVLGIALLAEGDQRWPTAPATDAADVDAPERTTRPPPEPGADDRAPTARDGGGGGQGRGAGRDRGGIPDELRGPVMPESQPVSIAIPRLDVFSSLLELRLDRSGAMEVPGGPAMAGWYALGPAPGALGPAVIAGHVNWNGVPGVFHRLGLLQAGDVLQVARADGLTGVFSVTRVRQVAKAAFPTDAVYGTVNHAGLRLITCGGAYDAAGHRYLDNVVVFARLVRWRSESHGRG